jgi:tryptophan synthase beta subunit
MTLEEYRSELNANFAKYKTDPAYRKDMEKKLENIVGRK